MAVTVKSEKQIALMREAGRLLAITHEELHKALKPGMTTLDIDRLGEEIIRDFGCVPNFKNYNGFPASICVSINDEVVHGIPTDKRKKEISSVWMQGSFTKAIIQMQPEHGESERSVLKHRDSLM